MTRDNDRSYRQCLVGELQQHWQMLVEISQQTFPRNKNFIVIWHLTLETLSCRQPILHLFACLLRAELHNTWEISRETRNVLHCDQSAFQLTSLHQITNSFTCILALLLPISIELLQWDNVSIAYWGSHTWPAKWQFRLHNRLLANHHHHHFWQAPLRVRSAERRHQSPEWTVLSQVNCVVHIEVAGFQILLNGFHPCNTRTSQWSPPVSCRGRLWILKF